MANALALEALGWIGRVRELIQKVRARVVRRVIKVKEIILRVERLESHADTQFFPLMREAAKAAAAGDDSAMHAALNRLVPADLMYWDEFHEITWEDGLKRPMIKLAEILGDEDLKKLLQELDGSED